MKLHELLRLNESTHTIQGNVTRLDQLRGKDGEYLAGTVNVAGNVYLHNMDLERLPVRFGSVGGDFYCSKNRLTTLEGMPGSVGENFSCWGNQLTSLVGVHRILRRIDGGLNIVGNPITSGGIGLILVEGLTQINTVQPAFKIINGFLGQGKPGLLRCQEALYEAGLEEFAKI